MTETERLRELLDERGAEYRVSATGYSIDIGPYITAYANRSDTTLDVSLRNVTPEQAVDATLGRGECELTDNGPWGYPYVCSACGASFDADANGGNFNFCPNCGRRVVEK